MLHFSTETCKNEQVSKVFRQNFSWNMPKTGLFLQYIFPKSLNAGGSPPDSRLDSMNKECAKTLLPLNIFDWCRCLEFWGKKMYYFIFSALSLSKNRLFLHHWGGWYSSTLQTNLAFKKNWNIARNIMCFIMNIVIVKQNFSALLIYLSFSKLRYRQNMFWSRNLSPNMPKITYFYWKIVKIAQSLRLCPQTPTPH